jgi:hypothetical protein
MTAAVVAALLVGFLTGLLAFRVKQRWCRVCGANLTCGDCINRTEVHGGVQPGH